MHLTDGLSINDVIKLVDFLYRRVGRSHLEPHPGRFTDCLESKRSDENYDIYNLTCR